MVGFSLKPKEEPVKKKFGGFTLKKPNVVAKTGLKPGAISQIEEDDTIKKIAIRSSDDLKEVEPKELVIDLKPNKSLIKVRKEEEVQQEAKSQLTYGLNVLDKKDNVTDDKRVVTKRDSTQMEDDIEEPNYTKMSVDDFGLLFLKGLGYEPELETKKQETTKKRKYGNLAGLGS